MDMPFRDAIGRRIAHAGDDQHRYRIGIGLGDRGRGVQQAGAGDEEADPRRARSPAVRHEACTLLVLRLDVADAAARQAAIELEHGIDPMLLQKPHQTLTAAEGVRP